MLSRFKNPVGKIKNQNWRHKRKKLLPGKTEKKM
jgi:hypothetical protein